MINDRSKTPPAVALRLAAACLLALAPLAGATAAGRAPAAQKVTPEEVIAKHLEAIGPAEARKPGRSRVISGGSLMDIRSGGRGQATGVALIASRGEKVLIKADFDSPSYPFERIGFDGKNLRAKPYAPGMRSPHAEFLLSHDATFSEGLIGGALSSAWPLLNLAERKAKLEYAGTAKVNGRQAHKLRYVPHEGSELKIQLFFDAENFRHLRSEYERVIPAAMGARPGQSASMREKRYLLVEDFSDFKAEGGLTLPHTYRIQYSVSEQAKPLNVDWTFNLKNFTFDYAIEDKEFVTDN